MPEFTFYPKEPFIGVDFSGQPNAPPMIAVATRYTRRKKEHKWIVRINADEIAQHRSKRDWQERIYASMAFKVIDKVLQPNYVIHIDEEYQNPRQQKKVINNIKYLIGIFHSGDPDRENPDIKTKTKYKSEYVMDAHLKHSKARTGEMHIDEKTGIGHLMTLLEQQKS
jgi:hypothetical protein